MFRIEYTILREESFPMQCEVKAKVVKRIKNAAYPKHSQEHAQIEIDLHAAEDPYTSACELHRCRGRVFQFTKLLANVSEKHNYLLSSIKETKPKSITLNQSSTPTYL